MVSVRRATAADAAFLGRMLALAADWRAIAPPPPVDEILQRPGTGHYIARWPQAGDVGFVAESDASIGAAWWRFFTRDDPGYGFVDQATPELSVAVSPDWRGKGVGASLLQALCEEARRLNMPALSLSVDPQNRAAHLYRRFGFHGVGRRGTSLTMVLAFGT